MDDEWKIDDNKAIYPQIMQEIINRIVSLRYKSGHKIPSVRELATKTKVSPNTVQRAFSELEREGLISTKRTVGSIVTEDANLIKRFRNETARKKIEECLISLYDMGLEAEEIKKLFKNSMEEDRWK